MGAVTYQLDTNRPSKDPYVSLELLEYLEESFNVDYLISQKFETGEETVGFIKGSREVIGHLRGIYEEEEEQELCASK